MNKNEELQIKRLIKISRMIYEQDKVFVDAVRIYDK